MLLSYMNYKRMCIGWEPSILYATYAFTNHPRVVTLFQSQVWENINLQVQDGCRQAQTYEVVLIHGNLRASFLFLFFLRGRV